MIEFVTAIIGLVTALISIILVFVQSRSHILEQKAYRQQLISLLHHAEGLRDSINSAQISTLSDAQANGMKLWNMIDSIKQNANALFFGIMETKVGGVQLLDDLDTKYKEWSSLELDRKIESAKQIIDMTKQNFQKYNKPNNAISTEIDNPKM
jgi:hypothetical protein